MSPVLIPRGKSTTNLHRQPNDKSYMVSIKHRAVPDTCYFQETTDSHEYERRTERQQAKKVVRYTRSSRTLSYGWSGNARSIEGRNYHAGLTLTPGAKRRASSCSSCSKESQSPPNTRIVLSRLPIQSQAVASIPTKALIAKFPVHKCTGQKTKFEKTDYHQRSVRALKVFETRPECSKCKCKFPSPHTSVSQLQGQMSSSSTQKKRQSSKESTNSLAKSHISAPIRYHAYFKHDAQKGTQLQAAGKPNNEESQRSSHRTRRIMFSKWKKCLTVDSENNIKCMISLCDDKCMPALGQNSLSHASTPDEEILYPHKQKGCRTAAHTTRKISPRLRHLHLHDSQKHIKAAKIRGIPRTKKSSRAPHHSLSAILCSPSCEFKTSHVDQSVTGEAESGAVYTNSSASIEGWQDTEVDLDFLKTPVMCPMNSSTRIPEKTPPTVSLENYQLVYLYKLVLKKVGVGFRLSPVDPRAATLANKSNPRGDLSHPSTNNPYPMTRQRCRHRAFVSPRMPRCAGFHSKFGNLSVNAEQAAAPEDTPELPMVDVKHREPCKRQDINQLAKVYSQHHDSSNARELGSFGNEKVYAFSSPSPSSRAPCASPGHTNRCGLYACSTSPKCIRKTLNNSRVQKKRNTTTFSKQASLPIMIATNDRPRSYRFVSCSPNKDQRLTERNKQNPGYDQSELRKREKIPKICTNKSPKSNKQIFKGNRSNVLQKRLGALESKSFNFLKEINENKEFLEYLYHNHQPEMDKRTSKISPLNRLESVVQKLTEILKQNQFPCKRTSVLKAETITKSPTMCNLNTSPTRRQKIKLKRLDQRDMSGETTLLARHMIESNLKIPRSYVPAVNKHRNLIQTKDFQMKTSRIHPGSNSSLKKRNIPTRRTPTAPFNAWTVPSSPQKRNPPVALHQNESCYSRGPGPPQLRTAARAAAKSLVSMESQTPHPRTSAETGKKRPARSHKEKCLKRTRHCKDNRNETSRQHLAMGKSITSDRAMRTCSTQFPVWRETGFPSDKPRASVASRRSPKNYNVNLNGDIEPRQAQQRKRHPDQDIRQKLMTCPRCSSPHARETSANGDYPSQKKVSIVTRSLSLDTSWDVSASQIFD